MGLILNPNDIADYSIITSRVLTGGAIRTQAAVQSLVQIGVTHVIDCRDTFDDASLLSSHPAISYLHNGTSDDGQPKPSTWFGKSIEFALMALAQPHTKVYAHCRHGVNRGPSTAFAILLALGFPEEAAIDLIRKCRPFVKLAYRKDAIRAIAELGYD